MGLACRIGWTPREFWCGSYHDLTVALAAWLAVRRKQEPSEMSTDQVEAFLGAAVSMGLAEAHHG